jgi:putative hydrolase of HD superfamily
MILDFFNKMADLKKIPRQGWIDKLNLKNPESVADHIFSMSVMGMVLSDMQDYNTEKILKIILLHDLAESITGDITPGQTSADKKRILENNAMKKLLVNLPKLLQIQYNKLWIEYQENKSKEAQFVHQLDKLEMALQAKIYSKDNKTISSFIDSAKNQITDPKLVKLLVKISNQP